MEEQKPTIYMGFPVYNRMVDVDIMSRVFSLACCGKYKLMIQTISGPYIDSNRNRMVEDFLKTECEWLFFWDTDVVFTDDNFLNQLIETAKEWNAPVVGAPYLLKNANKEYCAVKMIDGELVNYKVGELDHIQRVFAMGAGSIIIHRSVLEEMVSPYFEITPKAGGVEMPEDFYFCDKVHKLGYEVVADTRITTYHFAPSAWLHEGTK